MPSPQYKQIRNEIRSKNKSEILNKRQKIILEQTIFRDLMEHSPKCEKCSRRENLTLDHIVPETILESFGIDTKCEIIEENYQLLCKFCNNFKGARLDFSTGYTKKVILKLLEKV